RDPHGMRNPAAREGALRRSDRQPNDRCWQIPEAAPDIFDGCSRFQSALDGAFMSSAQSSRLPMDRTSFLSVAYLPHVESTGGDILMIESFLEAAMSRLLAVAVAVAV